MTDLSGLSDDELLRMLGQQQAGPRTAPVAPPVAEMADEQILAALGIAPAPVGDPSKASSGFAQGLMDPAVAATQIGARLPSNMEGMNAFTMGFMPGMDGVGPMGVSSAEFDQQLKQDEANYQARRKVEGDEGIDWDRLGGQVAGTAPLMAMAPVPATIGQATGIGIGTGALSGLLSPVTNGGEDFWKEKGKQVGINVAGGLVGGPLAYGASRVVQPQTDKVVKALMERGITPTPGQILRGGWQRAEEKLTSVPVLGDLIKNSQRRAVQDLNRAAYDSALDNIGTKASGAVGREGVEEVKRTIQGAYDKLLPKLKLVPDDQLLSEVESALGRAAMVPDAVKQQARDFFEQQVTNRLRETGGVIDGNTFKGIESEFARVASKMKADPRYDVNRMGEALDDVLGALRQNLDRSNPEFAGELAKINRAWAEYARIRDAAGRTGATDGVFSPAQLQAAVRAGDKSKGKDAFARGTALGQDLSDAAVDVLGQAYPDSGTPGRIFAGALGAGGLGMVNPLIPMGVGAAALPYTSVGQRLAAALLTQRPSVAGPVAEGVRRGGVPASVAIAQMLAQSNQ